MGIPAEDRSVVTIVADAFAARDATFRGLIAELNGGPVSQRADALARKLGLKDRFQLAYRLRRAGLPSFVDLRAILRVVTWVHRWETEGLSLARQALSEGRDPAAYSKTVRHVTGHSWSDIRQRGAHAVAGVLATRFRGGSAT
jgi:hypothetical protein